MKLLPKKQELQKQLVDEKKSQIDEGIALAKRIDSLRETLVNEERRLKDWRATSLKIVQDEINQLIEERNNLEQQNNEARILRNKMLKPLDEEWKEVTNEKTILEKEKQTVYLSKEQLEKDKKDIEEKWNEVSEIVINTKEKEEQIEKLKSETIALKELASREYEIAREEHEKYTLMHEKESSDIRHLKEEYENGITINSIVEKELKDKEADLIIRERELERRQKNFQSAQQIK